MPPVTIYGNIADPGFSTLKDRQGRVAEHRAVILWYWLRSQDPNGSGQVLFSLKAAACDLRVSIETVRRWIYWGLKNGLFRSAALRGPVGHKRVFLTKALDVARSLGADDLGICFEIPADQLWQLPAAVTEAVASHLQRASIFSAKQRSKSGSGKALTLEDVLGDKRIGANVARGERFSYFDSTVSLIGGSQTTIADFLGRHRSTVQRRLSNSVRSQHGLEPIKRYQLAQARVSFGVTLRPVFDEDYAAKYFRPDWSRSTIFEAMCNVYDDSHVLLQSKRRLKDKLKRAIAKGQPISSTNSRKMAPPGDPTISTTDHSRVREDIKTSFGNRPQDPPKTPPRYKTHK